MRTILGYTARLTGSGLAVGFTMAIAGTRMLSTLLYGVSPLDPTTFLVVLALLAIVALLAAIVPTLTASAVDPAITLREE